MRLLAATLLVLVSAGAVVFYREGRLGAELSNTPAGYATTLELPRAKEGYLRVLAAGDVGTDDWRQHRVARAMEALARKPGGVDLVLLLGDLFYPHGVTSAEDDRWRTGFREMYTGALMETTFRPISGNHDLDGSLDALLEYADLDPRWAMEGLHYSFSRAFPGVEQGQTGPGVAFFALDTTAMVISEEGAVRELEWLEGELSRAEAVWRVVYGHHPIDSGGRHGGEPILRERLIPLLREHGVDFYLAGHDHYLALLEIDGLLTIVSGSGGKVRDASWTPNTRFAAARLGFTELLFGRSQAFVRFHESSGELLYSERVVKTSIDGA